jgi:DNA-directed RNA polymerase subunit N
MQTAGWFIGRANKEIEQIKAFSEKKIGGTMIIPVRCITCGKPVGGLWEKFKEKVARGQNAGKVLDELGLERYCCRSLFLTHVDNLASVSKFRI